MGNLKQNFANGDLLSRSGANSLTLTWDAEGRLQAANNESYDYDDQGRRIKKTVGASVTHYLYNGPDIHVELNAAYQIQAVYAHGPNWDDPVIRMTGQTNQPSANASYYHQDGLNSAVAVTDNLGSTQGTQRFDAWGTKLASTGSIAQYGYTGREPDATGLMYYRARYYDPSLGRFISKDPAGMPDGVNRYAYVKNSPVMLTDPWGLQAANPLLMMLASNDLSYYNTPFVNKINIDLIRPRFRASPKLAWRDLRMGRCLPAGQHQQGRLPICGCRSGSGTDGRI